MKINQILPHPGDPQLYESHVKSAATYVELAERTKGPIPKPVSSPVRWTPQWSRPGTMNNRRKPSTGSVLIFTRSGGHLSKLGMIRAEVMDGEYSTGIHG